MALASSFDEERKKEAKKRHKVVDIIHKMTIAKHILKMCEEESSHLHFPVEQLNNRLLHYTKEEEKYLLFQAKLSAKAAVNNLEWMFEHRTHKPNAKSYGYIREIIHDLYTNKRTLPTRNNILQRIIVNHKRDNKNTVESDLKNAGFTWIPVPGTKKSIIVEDTQQFNIRRNYLQKIAHYREQGRNIVYVGERNVHSQVVLAENWFKNGVYIIVVGSVNGYGNVYCIHNIGKYGVGYQQLERFLVEAVALNVPERSVIVMGTYDHHEKLTITEHSSKKQMITWLYTHRIEHDKDMHRADLYELIERCKHNLDLQIFKIDQCLAKFGHTTLHRPFGLRELDFFTDFWDTVIATKKEYCGKFFYKSVINSAKNSYTAKQLQDIEKDIIFNEQKYIEEDMQMEEIVDKLLTIAKKGQVTNIDFDRDYDNDLNDVTLLKNVIIQE